MTVIVHVLLDQYKILPIETTHMYLSPKPTSILIKDKIFYVALHRIIQFEPRM